MIILRHWKVLIHLDWGCLFKRENWRIILLDAVICSLSAENLLLIANSISCLTFILLSLSGGVRMGRNTTTFLLLNYARRDGTMVIMICD